MPRINLTDHESSQMLETQKLVRVAFHDGQSSYLIPLGYVWLQSTFYGVADAGRKTRMAETNSQVSFQVDTSKDTGLWEWCSITGEGTFEIVDNDEGKQQALSALQPVIAQAPEWWRCEQGPRMATGELLVWKTTPTSISGCEYVPPDDAAL